MLKRLALRVPWCIAAVAGVTLILRAVAGPLPNFHSPMNAEGAFGFAIVLLLMTRSTSDEPSAGIPKSSIRQAIFMAVALIVIAAAAFRRTIHFYFLSDDFILLKYANARLNLLPLFTTGGGDGFFRPIGYLSMSLNSLWASLNPAYWHASALALHLANSLLVFLLAFQVCSSRIGAFFAGLLFAVHGSRPEAVAWIASEFDRVSAFFVLCGLVLFIRSLAKPRVPGFYRMMSLVSMVLAILSKESAYTFPLLLWLFMFQQKSPNVSREQLGKYRILIPFFSVAALLFGLRWILFGGVGGYRDAHSGQFMAATVHVIPALKVLLFRLWAVLFFPVNWKIQPALVLSILLSACLLAFCRLSAVRIGRSRIIFALGFVLITALPPLHLLLIGSDLQGARLLYLPSVGFCLLVALAAERLPSWLRYAIPGVLVVFQLAALEHNLDRWAYAAQKAKEACTTAARCVGPAGKYEVVGLPRSLDGVFFFANGFPESLEMQRTRLASPEGTGDRITRLWWDESAEELRCMK